MITLATVLEYLDSHQFATGKEGCA